MPYTKVEDRRAFFKRRYELVKEELRKYKLVHGCKDCGYKKHYAALEFDHLPQFEKICNVSKAMGRGLARTFKELEKCEVVCSNCHSIRTWQRQQGTID